MSSPFSLKYERKYILLPPQTVVSPVANLINMVPKRVNRAYLFNGFRKVSNIIIYINRV
jgi:hypothetical protein